MTRHQILSILVHLFPLTTLSAELVCDSTQQFTSTSFQGSASASEEVSSIDFGGGDASLSLAQLRARRFSFDEDVVGQRTGTGALRVVQNVNVTELAMQPTIDQLELTKLISSGALTGAHSMSHLRHSLAFAQGTPGFDRMFKLEMYFSGFHSWAKPICGVMNPYHFAVKIKVDNVTTGCVTHISPGDWSESYTEGFTKSVDWFFEKIGFNPQIKLVFNNWVEEPLLTGGDECNFDEGDWCHMYKTKILSASGIELLDTWVEETIGSEEEGHMINLRYRLSLAQDSMRQEDLEKVAQQTVKLPPPLDTGITREGTPKQKSIMESPFAKVQAAIQKLEQLSGEQLDPSKPWYVAVREEMTKDAGMRDIIKAAVVAEMSDDPKVKAELMQSIQEMIVEDQEYRAANNVSKADIQAGYLEPANPNLQHATLVSSQPGPVGTCSIFGDPHVMGFDHTPIKPVISLLDVGSNTAHKVSPQDSSSASGDFWLVRTPQVYIQGRFNKVEEGRLFLRGLAVSGPFLKGNVLLISGHTDGRVSWNKQEILNATPSEFWNEGLISARHRTEKLVQDPARTAELPGYDMELPLGVKLLVNRGSRGLGVKIMMPRQPGHQDGQCGNFNGDGKDDTPALISGRMAFEDLLFRNPFVEDDAAGLDQPLKGPLHAQGIELSGLLPLQPTAKGEKTCTIFGDPHIIGFDRILELNQDIEGDFWIVKHKLIQIQGRYFQESNKTHRSFLRKLAISGPLLKYNTLFIGKNNGKVFWNNEEILSSIPSNFSNDLIFAKYHSIHLSPFPKIDMELRLGVKLLINRGKGVLGMRMTMPVANLTGRFDGQCGDANGMEDADPLGLLETGSSMRVEPKDLLFHKALHGKLRKSDSSSNGQADEHEIL